MRSINKGKHIKVEDENGCTVCTSHVPNKDGYIRLYAGKGNMPRMQFLHRMVWEGFHGEVPEGFEIDHKCRNRRCCNVNHLQLLTIVDHKIKTNKERYAERTEGIQFAIQEGYPVKDIAKAFGVTVHTVNANKRKLNDIH